MIITLNISAENGALLKDMIEHTDWQRPDGLTDAAALKKYIADNLRMQVKARQKAVARRAAYDNVNVSELIT